MAVTCSYSKSNYERVCFHTLDYWSGYRCLILDMSAQQSSHPLGQQEGKEMQLHSLRLHDHHVMCIALFVFDLYAHTFILGALMDIHVTCINSVGFIWMKLQILKYGFNWLAIQLFPSME